jgi:16S rRNA (cytosine967-C5)-methyltransferase
MPAATDPRLVAIANLAAVVDGRSLDGVLADCAAQLPEQDRAFAAELSYGLCRWYRQLHAVIAARLNKPLRDKDRDLHFLLMLGAYQLLHGNTPAHAAVSTSVELTRRLNKAWAGKLVNAVLRGIQRDMGHADSPLQRQIHSDLTLRFAQPKWFVKALQQAWPGREEAILDALQARAPMTLRLNIRHCPRADYLARLSVQGIQAQALDAVPTAVVLQRPLPVQQVPGFEDGLVSVQDAGAQLAGQLLDVRPGQRVLDACAAPGGKTGHILELADELEVTAVDLDAQRLQRVTQNLGRLQRTAQVRVADAANPPPAWREQPFDRILVDAPCSATGVMRRHPDIRLLRRRDDIDNLARRQAGILDALWPCLRAGGKLLYATCSLLPQENHLQVEAFLQRTPDARSIGLAHSWGHACAVGRQTLPGEMTMDGFYYALLEKVHA